MQALTFFFAFIAVLALIGAAAWLVRRFAGNRLGANANRGRMPRLAVIDAAAVDGRRRLVLVRRDNVEHLLMIGGPTDIVVEPNIVRAMPARDRRRNARYRQAESAALHRCPMPAAGPTAMPPPTPEPPMPEPPPRPARPSFAECAVRRPVPERRSDPLAGFTPEPMSRSRHPRTRRRPAARRSRWCRVPRGRSNRRRRRRSAPRTCRGSAPPPPRACLSAPIRISPRWRSGSRPHFARPAGDRRAGSARRPSHPNRRRAAPRPPKRPAPPRWARRPAEIRVRES